MRPIVADQVAWSVCWLVCRCVTAELTEMPFGLSTRVDPRNHVLDGGPDPHEKGQFRWWKGRPDVKYGDTLW